MEIITENAEETKELGRKIGVNAKRGQVIALTGDLGSGKTTLIQGIAYALGIKTRVISPTFILMREYKVTIKSIENLYHIDLYRLEENISQELINLGFKEIIGNKDSVVVVEWAEKAKELFPASTIWVKFEKINNSHRKIVINN